MNPRLDDARYLVLVDHDDNEDVQEILTVISEGRAVPVSDTRPSIFARVPWLRGFALPTGPVHCPCSLFSGPGTWERRPAA
jgi:hypothetical protein